jgi:lipopolysaccharide transport system permease protein
MPSSQEHPIRVYSADAARTSLVASLRKAGSEVWAAREVIWRLFLRDLTAQFRQRLFGYLWTIISPLLGVASFLFLNYTGILNPGELKIPYAIYVFFGTSLWGFMTGVVASVSGSLLAHGDLILRTSVPKIAIAMAGLAGLIYAQLVNLIILLIMLLVYGVIPSIGALALPIMLVPLIGFALAIGLVVAVVGVAARDISSMVTHVLGLAMYITPVIYVRTFDQPIAQAIVTYNPLTYLIDEPRNVFFLGFIQHPLGFAIAALFSASIAIFAIHGFYLIQDIVPERM